MIHLSNSFHFYISITHLLGEPVARGYTAGRPSSSQTVHQTSSVCERNDDENDALGSDAADFLTSDATMKTEIREDDPDYMPDEADLDFYPVEQKPEKTQTKSKFSYTEVSNIHTTDSMSKSNPLKLPYSRLVNGYAFQNPADGLKRKPNS